MEKDKDTSKDRTKDAIIISKAAKRRHKRAERRKAIRKKVDFSRPRPAAGAVRDKHMSRLRRRLSNMRSDIRASTTDAALADLAIAKQALYSQEKGKVLLGEHVSKEREMLRSKQAKEKKAYRRLMRFKQTVPLNDE